MTADTDLSADTREERTPVGVVPYLAVSDGHCALAWYAEALGATECGDRYEADDGRIGHAALRVHGAVFYLSDGAPQLGVVAPQRRDAPVSSSLVLTVPDVDGAADRAVAAGTALERAPGDNPYGRVAVVRDPFGHRWMLEGLLLAAAAAPPADRSRAGDLAYLALWTPDAALAEAFYATVLGWQVAPGSGEQGRQVTGQSIGTGISGGHQLGTVFCCWQVHDAEEAVRRVRRAGGTAQQPRDEPYGRIADCVDDQGLPFAVYAPTPELAGGPRVPPNGARPGDLSYLTMEAPDGDRTRAFYTAVLGWGDGPDGAPDVHPMLGLASGRDVCAVPMWKVDDVPAAVEQVRAAGGTADEPEQKPYGALARCTDDQGMRFYLGDS